MQVPSATPRGYEELSREPWTSDDKQAALFLAGGVLPPVWVWAGAAGTLMDVRVD